MEKNLGCSLQRTVWRGFEGKSKEDGGGEVEEIRNRARPREIDEGKNRQDGEEKMRKKEKKRSVEKGLWKW